MAKLRLASMSIAERMRPWISFTHRSCSTAKLTENGFASGILIIYYLIKITSLPASTIIVSITLPQARDSLVSGVFAARRFPKGHGNNPQSTAASWNCKRHHQETPCLPSVWFVVGDTRREHRRRLFPSKMSRGSAINPSPRRPSGLRCRRTNLTRLLERRGAVNRFGTFGIS